MSHINKFAQFFCFPPSPGAKVMSCSGSGYCLRHVLSEADGDNGRTGLSLSPHVTEFICFFVCISPQLLVHLLTPPQSTYLPTTPSMIFSPVCESSGAVPFPTIQLNVDTGVTGSQGGREATTGGSLSEVWPRL